MGGAEEEEDQEGAAAAVIGSGRCCEPSGSNHSPASRLFSQTCNSRLFSTDMTRHGGGCGVPSVRLVDSQHEELPAWGVVTWYVAGVEDEEGRAGCRVRWSIGVDYHNSKTAQTASSQGWMGLDTPRLPA
ncbi:hypothetical protein E2C01_041299 [Portunus trituberculatus]|uniref:Uncharacterized protein n=1 Tax=Portunus trituberculatus TaxID=210409 RepID=A0A5B7FIV8_PORTR|nr:hypothetical protein [Portunus trituberculatus]